MVSSFYNVTRLLRTAFVLAKYDALAPINFGPHPGLGLRFVNALRRLIKLTVSHQPRTVDEGSPGHGLAAALQALGPTYIKLGQFLATRPDVIGPENARDLSLLQDRLPPFSEAEARATVERELGNPAEKIFDDFGPAVAAASIAQVHRARLKSDDGSDRHVAVKILRPGIEQQMQRDLESFFWAARLIERRVPSLRRLRPVEVVRTLADSIALEMDLRLEAAAIAEMAENIAGDEGFRTPEVIWAHTERRVLTLEWVDGIRAGDREAIISAGHDMPALARCVIQSFLRHAMRDGFFHADMHQGNLFVLPDSAIMAVDYGIVGRLAPKDRKFLAETLFGFLSGDYKGVAEKHFDAGYVPVTKSVETFAQALRAIGEPISGQNADQISMGRLLQQLFLVTAQFDMETQPQLLLLQKTMVVVEGVARDFDPEHNIWASAEPILREWLEANLGPEAQIRDAVQGAVRLAHSLKDLPDFVDEARMSAHQLKNLLAEKSRRGSPRNGTQNDRDGRVLGWLALGIATVALLLVVVTQLL